MASFWGRPEGLGAESITANRAYGFRARRGARHRGGRRPDPLAAPRNDTGEGTADMATFLVAHGARSAGWAWKKMRPLMRAAGHEFFTPTYTGLGERAHLAHADITLDSHIQDILAVLEAEDLRDVYLIGHSYGGMVATCVTDRARDRVKHIIYVDAFAPKDGQSAFDLQQPAQVMQRREAARRDGDGWRLATGPMPPDTSPEDVAWA